MSNQKKVFRDLSLRYIDWPACSSNFKPIEKICNVVERRILKEPRQVNNGLELKESINTDWNKIKVNE